MHIAAGQQYSHESVPDTRAISLEGVREHRVLKSGFLALDRFTGGFQASKLTLLDGSNGFVNDLASALCVRAVLAFGEDVVLVDGGNTADPYGMAALCRRLGADSGAVLSRVNVARAFTAYQMAALLNDRLKDAVKKSVASTVVVSSLVDLFFDKDMAWPESFQLIKRSVAALKRLAAERNLVTVVTNHGLPKLRLRRNLKNLMREAPDEAFVLEDRVWGGAHGGRRGPGRNKGWALRVSRQGTGEFAYMYPASVSQATLDDFGPGVEA